VNHVATSWTHRRYVVEERTALRRARLVICNSRRTVEDVIEHAGVCRARAQVVYYGTDPDMFGSVDPEERDEWRSRLGLDWRRPAAVFAGALGDRRKNFDTLFAAWRQLCTRRDWDVDLLVAGTGAELPAWKARAARELPPGRIRFLGYRTDFRSVLAASDVVIHPARYEPYGLVVHEALCRGIPAIVAAEIVRRMLGWRSDGEIAGRVGAFGARLRSRTWDAMARELVSTIGGTPA
jgi:glycosyltransferase involved in cell wall biosynthesis